MVGLFTETACWKERVFFGLVLANFSFAFAMGIWKSASETLVHETRLISAGAWGAAALVSLMLLFSKGNADHTSEKSS